MKRKGEIKFFFGGAAFFGACVYIFFKVVFMPLTFEKLPSDGDVINSIFPPNPFERTESVWHSITSKFYYAIYLGVKYRIFVDLKEDGKWYVISVQTCDPNFVSEEGFSPGKQSDEEIANKLGVEAGKMSIELSGGWHVVQTSDGAELKQCFNRYN